MSMTLADEATLALSAAVRNGVVDTVLHPFANPLITNLLGYVRKHKSEHLQDPNTFEPYQHPRSTTFQANSMPKTVSPFLSNHMCIEVARFVVPKGSVGFVEYIEQVVNDANGDYYPTNEAYWGSPTSVIDEVDDIRWWLKLDYFNGVEPARFAFSDAAAFGSEAAPGMPYSEMPEIDSLWYPAHNNKRIKLIVPGARMLRFFFYSPPLTEYAWQVRGRLTGYTQSTYNTESMRNARHLL